MMGSITENSDDSFKMKLIEQAFQMPEYKAKLKYLTNNLIGNSQSAKNEATVATQFEVLLYSFISNNLGLDILPVKEDDIETKRHITKGRIDSRIGALVIEYKHFSKLKTLQQKKSAIKQIKTYIDALYNKENKGVYGLVTDGVQVAFINAADNGEISESPFAPLKHGDLDRIIRTVVLLEKTALTSDNLVKSFCDNGVAKELFVTLYEEITQNITGRTQMLFNEWKALFKLAHDDVSKLHLKRSMQHRH